MWYMVFLFSAAKLAEKKLKEKLNPAVLIPLHVNNCSSYHKKITRSGRKDGICTIKESQVSSGQALFYSSFMLLRISGLFK